MVGEGNIATVCWFEKEDIHIPGGRMMGLFVTTNGSYSFRCRGSAESIKFKDKSSVKTRLSSLFRHCSLK